MLVLTTDSASVWNSSVSFVHSHNTCWGSPQTCEIIGNQDTNWSFHLGVVTPSASHKHQTESCTTGNEAMVFLASYTKKSICGVLYLRYKDSSGSKYLFLLSCLYTAGSSLQFHWLDEGGGSHPPFSLITHPIQLLSVQFSCSVVSVSVIPWTAARQASLSITNFLSLLKLMSIESVMPSTISSSASPSPPAFNLSQHRGVFQWVSSLHQAAKVLELQACHLACWYIKMNIYWASRSQVEVDLSTTLDQFGSNQFMWCLQVMSFF